MKNTSHYMLIIFILFFSCKKQESIQERFYSHVSYLASDQLEGRYPASDGDSLSQEYITKYFSKIKLSSLYSESNYLQEFPFLCKIQASDSNHINFHLHDTTFEMKNGKDFIVYTQSGSGDVIGNIVFIGYGIDAPESQYDDYRKINLKDKIAICYIIPPKDIEKKIKIMAWKYKRIEKTKLLTSLGCKAVIYVLPKSYWKHDTLVSLKNRRKIYQKIQRINIPSLQISYSAFEKLMSLIDIDLKALDEKLLTSKSSLAFTLPNLVSKIKVKLDYIFKNSANIVGFIPKNNSDQTIVIGAHYDHIGIDNRYSDTDSICNGADDNASGVAMLLETAKYFAETNQNMCNLCFITFGAEESGSIGSKHFLNNLHPDIGNIKAMINFDMVGRMISDTLYVNHHETALEWDSCLFSKKYDSSLILVKDELKAWTDSKVFVKKEIPSLFFTTGLHSDYHKPSDEYTKINYEGMEKIYILSIDLIKNISQKSVQLTFVK